MNTLGGAQLCHPQVSAALQGLRIVCHLLVIFIVVPVAATCLCVPVLMHARDAHVQKVGMHVQHLAFATCCVRSCCCAKAGKSGGCSFYQVGTAWLDYEVHCVRLCWPLLLLLLPQVTCTQNASSWMNAKWGGV